MPPSSSTSTGKLRGYHLSKWGDSGNERGVGLSMGGRRLGAMEWDARIVEGVNLDGIFRLTLLSLSAHFVTSTTSVLPLSWKFKVQDHH